MGEDRLQYKGTKTTEGLSKFLIKNLGDEIVPNLLEVPEKLDALNELDSETFADHVAIGNHLVNFEILIHCVSYIDACLRISFLISHRLNSMLHGVDIVKYVTMIVTDVMT